MRHAKSRNISEDALFVAVLSAARFQLRCAELRTERVADAYVTLSECSAIAIIKHVPHAFLLELFQFGQ